MASIALALPLTVLLPGLVAGCGDDTVDPGAASSPTTPETTPATTPATPAPASLDGRTFLSTGSAGFEFVDGTVVRIEFRDDSTFSASAGCNLLGGAYRIDGDTLRIAFTIKGQAERPTELKADGKKTGVITLKREKEKKDK